ncbi:PREDICTED: protein GAMETE EXPRESSED 3 [Ipomoea nil]|uniref:protein GAMETE EXPRESSED 3 n=1 Tax=Ipomoea nil TaxID=35883 RepID=UPI00090181E3|nr:PREDICTED: protein GAMETE EXPRESSED 3 [Ipomoea nil]
MSLQFRILPTLISFMLPCFAFFVSSTQPLYSNPPFISGQESFRNAAHKLNRPLVGDDGRVYACSGRNFFAFESNGSIAWSVSLNYKCSAKIAPVNGGSRKIYVVAEDRVLKINPLNIGGSESAVQVFFGPKQPGAETPGEIVGIAVSISSSRVLITVKKRGLFAYRLHGKLVWSAGPVLYQHGFRLGCRKSLADCYFLSAPVIDHCEASIYILNNWGELYALSTTTPHFLWIQDLSSFGNISAITPGNNGLVYITVPDRALILALDVSRGNISWQGSVGPLSTADYAPVVDSNGWISVGSLNGFVYSFSPHGVVKKFPRVADRASVIQVSPILDCSGYALYVSQTEMDGKVSQIIGDYTFITAMNPRTVAFTMLVPASGSLLFSEKYPGPFSSRLVESDLRRFVCDEQIILAFFAASRINNPFQCISTRQKFAVSCSQITPKSINIYTGNERAVVLFLSFETTLLVVLAALVRFCCVFWNKKKLQGQELGKFLEKRHSLQLQKKAFDRTISELEQKAANEVAGAEVIEQLGDLVRERGGVERKLSTTYSLGRDETGLQGSLLPLSDRTTRSFSFRDANKESITVFHTADSTESDLGEAWSCSDEDDEEDEDEEIGEEEYEASPSSSGSSSNGGLSASFDGIEDAGIVPAAKAVIK